jgi:flagellin
MTVNNIARNQMSPAMQRLASGNRVNSAADDAAGLAIIENMTAQINGLDQGTRNTLDMQGLVNTAEGALDTVSGSLQRIRELSVQALNDTNTPGNRQMIQQEITQLANHVESAVSNTQFNSRNLLDGGGENLNLATGPGGQGTNINIRDMSDLAQAVSSINVSGSRESFQDVIARVDDALQDVSQRRAELGAQSNRMDHIVSANTISSLNMADSRSRIRDADMAREMAAFVQDRVINDMQMLMEQQNQRRVQEENQTVIGTAAR